MLFSKLKSVLPLPKLHAPTIEVNGSELSVTNPENNGGFAEQWELYSSGNASPLVTKEIGETTANLDEVPSHLMSEDLFVRFSATGFVRSDISNIVQYFKRQPLSEDRLLLAGASTNNFAVFAGGISTTHSATVDVFNANLVRFTPTELSEARSSLSGTTIGEYALFAGGKTSFGYSKKVDAYSDDLTRVSATDLTEERSDCAIVVINDKCIVFGGKNSSVSGDSVICDVYDADLTKYNSFELEHSHAYGAAAVADWYVAVAGGVNCTTGTIISAVDMIDSELTYIMPEELFTARAYHKAETIGSYDFGNISAAFGTGNNDEGTANDIEYFDVGMAHYVLPQTFDSAVSDYACVRVNDDVLFAGGVCAIAESFVKKIDNAFTVHTLPDLTYSRYSHAGCTVGDKVLFAGGGQGNSRLASIEIYDADYRHSIIN